MFVMLPATTTEAKTAQISAVVVSVFIQGKAVSRDIAHQDQEGQPLPFFQHFQAV